MDIWGLLLVFDVVYLCLFVFFICGFHLVSVTSLMICDISMNLVGVCQLRIVQVAKVYTVDVTLLLN